MESTGTLRPRNQSKSIEIKRNQTKSNEIKQHNQIQKQSVSSTLCTSTLLFALDFAPTLHCDGAVYYDPEKIKRGEKKKKGQVDVGR
eukprot:31925-Rhodomonas_salina.2